MKRSPLGLFKTPKTRTRKRANHDRNIAMRAALHKKKAFEGNPGKVNEIQQEIDAISLGPIQSLMN